jgi:hypothetical protein
MRFAVGLALGIGTPNHLLPPLALRQSGTDVPDECERPPVSGENRKLV